MATIINDRDILLQAAPTRLLDTELSPTVSIPGDVTGTLNGEPVQDVIDAANATSGTDNFFSQSSSDPTGGADGDAHYNSSTFVMWFNIGGTWTKGGTVNASQIITGTLAAARIAANSISADKINVSTLSAIVANLGSVNAGTITGSANITISGTADFRGSFSAGGLNSAISANQGNAAVYGITTQTDHFAGSAIRATTTDSGQGVWGRSTDSAGIGVRAENTGTGTALQVWGKMTIDNTTKVTNLNADLLDGFSSSAFLQASGVAADSSKLGGVASSSWARIFPTDNSTANASGAGLNLLSTVTGVESNGSGNTVTYRNISDRRKKKDIEPNDLGLDFLLKHQTRKYRMKAGSGLIEYGMIAQEVEQIVNDKDSSLVCIHEDGMKGISYNGYISILIKAVQELSKEVVDLKDRLDAIT